MLTPMGIPSFDVEQKGIFKNKILKIVRASLRAQRLFRSRKRCRLCPPKIRKGWSRQIRREGESSLALSHHGAQSR